MIHERAERVRNRGYSTGLFSFLLVFGLPARGRADMMTPQDRVQLLYSNRFVFTRQGIPLVTVRLMEGKHKVVLGSAKGASVLPIGPNGPEVTGGKWWEIKVEAGRPARVRYWVVVDRKAGAAQQWGNDGVLLWRRRGQNVRLFETGSVFAVSGQVVDNRTTLLCASPGYSLADARKASSSLARKHGIRTSLHAELVKRSEGTVVARDLSSGMAIRSHGMLWFKPVSTHHRLTVQRVEYGRGYSWHGFAHRQYWGQVYVAVDRNGKLAVVNAVPADRLLMGLVPAEIFPSSPAEALNAQAVAARGQLLAKLGKRHLADPYLLCASQHCQVYSGAGKEHKRTSHAVKVTRGLVLLSKNGRLADTVYHAASGGHTENNELVWHTTPNPHLRGRLDPLAARSHWGKRLRNPRDLNKHIREWILSPPRTYASMAGINRKGVIRWKVYHSLEDLGRNVNRYHRVGKIKAITVLERGVSGRSIRLRIDGSLSSVVVSGELRIRRVLKNLKSSMFIVKREREADGSLKGFLFQGGGWGHGVGMCQMGAIGMARARLSFRQILAHYYPKTRLVKLY